MAIYENIAIALLLTVSMITANQPEFIQTPQPYRSLDRQDKFNGNYNEAMDDLSSAGSKRLRGSAPSDPLGPNSENYSNYRSQQASNQARQHPAASSRQYEVPSVDYDVTVNRNGDPAYYNEPSTYVQSPASK